MSEFAKEIEPVTIEKELKQSYLDYAMSVIVSRALPDIRDGLKPVHRRVLYAMQELGNEWNKPYKKSARVVGDVIGKYHPHGDSAVYGALVRMTQPFSLRYPLIDGQGNFGSVDGDAPAAMRYTEVRMSKITHSLLADLDKETVDFVPNYDETEMAPVVLPTRVPNLLINGSSGIAVGMATNIPPHNLTEVVTACLALIDKPDTDIKTLMEIIPGPDFPTAAIINGREGIARAYHSGRGRIYVRARTHVETDEHSKKERLIVTELPYQVNKAKLIEKIAELVKEKKIDGITALRDESDKDGMRIVIEIRRGESLEVIENQLYALTSLQNVFGINMIALVNGRPKLLGLKPFLDEFIHHRREVVTRRSDYELRKARNRAHLLEGLGIALANIEEVIALIKSSKNPAEAKDRLLAKTWALGLVGAMLEKAGDICRPDGLISEYGIHEKSYSLSPAQAQAILDLRLHRLTGLEQEKIINEYKELIDQIQALLEILNNPEHLMVVIREELVEIKKQFGDARRTEIIADHSDINLEDLIEDESVVVTISHQGYAKIQSLDVYQSQRRGGKGKTATKVKDEDFVEHLLIANTHDTILCFSNFGKAYWLKVYKLPMAGRTSRGKPLVNLLPLAKDEHINAILPLRSYDEDKYICMVTASATIKKVKLTEFSRPRSSGKIAIDLLENDQLVGVSITDGSNDIMLFTDAGKVIRFHEDAVRAMGRTARGVRGIKLMEGQQVISSAVVREGGAILTVTKNGYGKRTAIEEYPVRGRGGQGVISIHVNERNGKVVAAQQVFDGDEVMLISSGGIAVRTPVDQISVIGRNTQGVRLIKLREGGSLVGMERIEEISTMTDEQ